MHRHRHEQIQCLHDTRITMPKCSVADVWYVGSELSTTAEEWLLMCGTLAEEWLAG